MDLQSRSGEEEHSVRSCIFTYCFGEGGGSALGPCVLLCLCDLRTEIFHRVSSRQGLRDAFNKDSFTEKHGHRFADGRTS